MTRRMELTYFDVIELWWQKVRVRMTQISGRAKKLIENLLGWSTAPHEGEWEYDELGRCLGGFAYADMAQSELEDYIASIEAENRTLKDLTE